MSKLIKKIIALATCFALTLCLFTACADGDASNSGSSSGTNNSSGSSSSNGGSDSSDDNSGETPDNSGEDNSGNWTIVVPGRD